MSIQLSYSAAQKYLLSPRAYYLHYILRLRPSELSSALFFGNAMDLGLNTILTQKMKDKPIDTSVAKDIFLKAWESQDVDGKKIVFSEPGTIKFSKTDQDETFLNETDIDDITVNGLDPAWVSMRRKGLMMIDAYVDQVLPRIKKVHFVQKHIKLTNQTGDSFIGFIDFCATFDNDKTYIMDNKTSSIKYKSDSVNTSEQLSTYYEAMREELNLDGAGYVVIPKKFRKQKIPFVPIEIQFGEINEELIAKTFQMYDEVLHGIKMGRFECNPEKCAQVPWGCGYRRYCESNGQDLTGLKYFSKDKK